MSVKTSMRPTSSARVIERRAGEQPQLAARRDDLLDLATDLLLGLIPQRLEELHELLRVLGLAAIVPQQLDTGLTEVVVGIEVEQGADPSIRDADHPLSIAEDDRLVDRIDDRQQPMTNGGRKALLLELTPVVTCVARATAIPRSTPTTGRSRR